MAYTFSVANTPATSGAAMYLLVSALITAGWTKVMDSDGTTYSSSGTQIASGAAFSNTNAWVRMRAPAVNQGSVANQTREITFQRGNTAVKWRVKYSASAGFTGGSPAAGVTPSATDEVFLTGAGTDAVPVFLDNFFSADGAYRWHVAAGGAAEGYSFIAWALTSTTTTALNAIFLDVMATGSYSTLDVDPAAICCLPGPGGVSNIQGTSFESTTRAPGVAASAYARAWYGATSNVGASITTNNVNVSMIAHGSDLGFTVGVGVNPFSSKDTLLPCLWGRRTQSATPAVGGLKGYSTLFKIGSATRTNVDSCDSTATKDLFYCYNMWLPWNGSTPVA